ncbi:unnamed protein product [Amoebophrya sp. A120]|nr:unnamed protein product [Amoebophrya sp. A120]|eukprot:GSA120T00003453001.1
MTFTCRAKVMRVMVSMCHSTHCAPRNADDDEFFRQYAEEADRKIREEAEARRNRTNEKEGREEDREKCEERDMEVLSPVLEKDAPAADDDGHAASLEQEEDPASGYSPAASTCSSLDTSTELPMVREPLTAKQEITFRIVKRVRLVLKLRQIARKWAFGKKEGALVGFEYYGCRPGHDTEYVKTRMLRAIHEYIHLCQTRIKELRTTGVEAAAKGSRKGRVKKRKEKIKGRTGGKIKLIPDVSGAPKDALNLAARPDGEEQMISPMGREDPTLAISDKWEKPIFSLKTKVERDDRVNVDSQGHSDSSRLAPLKDFWAEYQRAKEALPTYKHV